MQPTNQEGMWRANRLAALEAVRRAGALSRVEIARALNLTPAAVTKIASDLIWIGLLNEDSRRHASGGRPRAPLALNPDWGRAVAISMTHTLAIGLVDMAGHLLRWRRLAEREQMAGTMEHFEAVLQRETRRVIEEEKGRRILGVGVLSNGRVGAGGLIHNKQFLPRRNVRMADALAPATDLPVMADEEFRLLLRWHFWRSGAEQRRNVVLMSGHLLGSGGGQAAMVEGRIYQGQHGIAGQRGRGVLLARGSDECERLWKRIVEMGGEEACVKRIMEGTPGAEEIYRAALDNYGYRLALIANFFDPELILVCGPFYPMRERFLRDVVPVMASHSENLGLAPPEVEFLAERTDPLRLSCAALPVLSRVFVEGECLE